jgi:hypothetical protein
LGKRYQVEEEVGEEEKSQAKGGQRSWVRKSRMEVVEESEGEETRNGKS